MKISENSTVTVGLVALVFALAFAVGRWVEWLYQEHSHQQAWRADIIGLFDRIERNQSQLIELAKEHKRRLDQLEAAQR